MKQIGILMVLGLGVLACQEKEKGKAVQAKLALANNTTSALTQGPCEGEGKACYTPTAYGLKLLSVYVSPDEQGAQSGPAGMVWINPGCDKKSIEGEKDGKTYTYDSPADGCDDTKAVYFDLARTTDEVNAELNSQNLSIYPGTYNYVQLEFCVGGPKGPNARFQAEGMAEPYEYAMGMCGLSSVKAETPMVVQEGESVTIELGYDLSQVIKDFGMSADAPKPDYCYVNEDRSVQRCFGYPKNLAPAIVP